MDYSDYNFRLEIEESIFTRSPIPEYTMKFYYRESYGDNEKEVFTRIIVDNGLIIPVYSDALTGVLRKCKLHNIPVPDFGFYKDGFLKGYESTFIPFIDKPEHRKEIIMKEVIKPAQGFPLLIKINKSGTPVYDYNPELFYQVGYDVGRIFKAWKIVFENPFSFESDFQRLIQKRIDEFKALIAKRNAPVVDSLNDKIDNPALNKEVPANKLLSYDYTKEQVENYFMQLAEKGFYTKDQINKFLKANFIEFAEPGEFANKIILPKIDSLPKNSLMHFIYVFWYKQENRKFKKSEASDLLINNFSAFNTDNMGFETLYKHMQNKPMNYPFSNTALC